MAERIIELRFSYDQDAAAAAFPRYPGDTEDPPIETAHFLVSHLTATIRSAIRLDPVLFGCVVDVLTVDHRNPPPSSTQAASDPNADYF